MRIVWSLPVPGETLDSPRGDIVRAASLIRGLRDEGHDVRVVEAAAHGGTARAVSSYRSRLAALPRPAARVLRDAGRLAVAGRHAARVAATAAELGAELIIETQVHMVPAGRRAARRAGLPLLLDDCSPPGEEAELGGGLAPLAGPLFRRQAAAAAALAVSSQALARRLTEDGVPASKVRVVPNGVPAAAAPAPAPDGSAVDLPGFRPGPRVAYLGSFQPWHRVDLLVAALPSLPPETTLLLVGAGAGRETALALAGSLGIAERVIAPGAVDPAAVPALLSACHVGVLPGTNAYGQPMKLLEYAAAGLPSVAPDLPPVREVLRPGETGLLFEPGNAGALAEALATLIANPELRGRMAAAARREAARPERSWRTAARKLLVGLVPGEAGSGGTP